MRARFLLTLLPIAVACSSSSSNDDPGTGGATSSSSVTKASASSSVASTASTTGSSFVTSASSGSGGAMACVDPATKLVPAGPEATLATQYAADYKVYNLGPVPGMPAGHLGGCVLSPTDPNTLYVAGDSEAASGQLYTIQVERDACGHIDAFVGMAQLVANTPYIDANLVFTPNETLLYTEWPIGNFGQLAPGATSPSSDVPLPLPNGDSPGGLGFVPSYLQASGGLRALGWPAGSWYHLDYTTNGNLIDISAATVVTTLANGPGGFAYVPPGSPDFSVSSLIVAEWSVGTVATYAVDMNGDPDPASRADFFTAFPSPWGAYFEPQTGDYLFLTWGSEPDQIYTVQGFTKPPPPPPLM